MPSKSSPKRGLKAIVQVPVKTRRQFTDAVKRKAVSYATKAGVVKAAVKFDVHPSAIYSWRKRGTAAIRHHEAAAGMDKVPHETYILTRKVQEALRATRSQGGDLTDLEIYSTLLVRKILGG